MIFDCILFNDELDLLELRLEFLNSTIDKFVIVEAPFTFSGNNKPLYYHENSERFIKYHDKIIHCAIPEDCNNKNDAWANEHFQRNYLKNALSSATDDDIVIISDVDEIINVEDIINKFVVNKPYLIELPVYYYFLNLKSTFSFAVNLISPFRHIKEINVGNRDLYKQLTGDVIRMSDVNTGWHFSYLFGSDISRYHRKLLSFSHTEYNTAYYLDAKRIERCVRYGIDLFERRYITYRLIDQREEFTGEFIKAINDRGLTDKYLMSIKNVRLNYGDIKFFMLFKFLPRVKKSLKKFIGAFKSGD